MTRQHFSIGIVERHHVRSAKGTDAILMRGCVGLIVEPDGWVSEVKSDGIEWVVEKRHAPKPADRSKDAPDA